MTLALARKTPLTALEEMARRYPDVPRLIILKTDVQRRGVFYTDEALSLLDETLHQVTGTHIFGSRDGKVVARPESYSGFRAILQPYFQNILSITPGSVPGLVEDTIEAYRPGKGGYVEVMINPV